MGDLEFDPDLLATLRTLETHRVEFVLVGDVANAIYNHGGVVSGVAIVPGNYGRNVERLASALNALNAEMGIAGRPDPRGRDWRRTDLRELAPCSFMTIYADVDVDFEPAGTTGYRDLFQDADRYELAAGARPHVASPDDLDRVTHGTGPGPAPVAPLAATRPPASPLPVSPREASSPQESPPPAIEPPGEAQEYDLGIWTEEEFRAIRAGRIPL